MEDWCCEKNGVGCNCGWDNHPGCACCGGEMSGDHPLYCSRCIEEATTYMILDTGEEHGPKTWWHACEERPWLFGMREMRPEELNIVPF